MPKWKKYLFESQDESFRNKDVGNLNFNFVIKTTALRQKRLSAISGKNIY